MHIELWKGIEGFEALYMVSTDGRIKSLNYNKTGRKKNMALNNHKRGYKHIVLCKNGKHKPFQVHRLVAQAFIPNPNNYPCVNHKDQNPSNNNVSNLEWCTHKYNNSYGTAIQKRVEKMQGRKLTEEHKKKISQNNQRLSGRKHPQSKKIYCVTTGEEFSYIRDAARKYNIDPSDIGKCCRGKRKTVGVLSDGTRLVWRYKEKEKTS
ncbi:NUMOD4 motif-containing HNH endonuclease [Terrisporobacter glycolicus]|nr:NUMOD4 motif-containing HNH endonuclease [Terrisporobacter glycolicus]